MNVEIPYCNLRLLARVGFDDAAQRAALQLPPRRAAQAAFKKRTISRAEGGQLQAPVGPQPRIGKRSGGNMAL